MGRHGKNATASAVYSYHEKKKDTGTSPEERGSSLALSLGSPALSLGSPAPIRPSPILDLVLLQVAGISISCFVVETVNLYETW